MAKYEVKIVKKEETAEDILQRKNKQIRILIFALLLSFLGF